MGQVCSEEACYDCCGPSCACDTPYGHDLWRERELEREYREADFARRANWAAGGRRGIWGGLFQNRRYYDPSFPGRLGPQVYGPHPQHPYPNPNPYAYPQPSPYPPQSPYLPQPPPILVQQPSTYFDPTTTGRRFSGIGSDFGSRHNFYNLSPEYHNRDRFDSGLGGSFQGHRRSRTYSGSPRFILPDEEEFGVGSGFDRDRFAKRALTFSGRGYKSDNNGLGGIRRASDLGLDYRQDQRPGLGYPSHNSEPPPILRGGSSSRIRGGAQEGLDYYSPTHNRSPRLGSGRPLPSGSRPLPSSRRRQSDVGYIGERPDFFGNTGRRNSNPNNNGNNFAGLRRDRDFDLEAERFRYRNNNELGGRIRSNSRDIGYDQEGELPPEYKSPRRRPLPLS